MEGNRSRYLSITAVVKEKSQKQTSLCNDVEILFAMLKRWRHDLNSGLFFKEKHTVNKTTLVSDVKRNAFPSPKRFRRLAGGSFACKWKKTPHRHTPMKKDTEISSHPLPPSEEHGTEDVPTHCNLPNTKSEFSHSHLVRWSQSSLQPTAD